MSVKLSYTVYSCECCSFNFTSLSLSLSTSLSLCLRLSLSVCLSLSHFVSDSGVLYIHVHGCQGIISHASRNDCQPYCVVRQGSDIILRTHSLSGPISSLLAWEKGIEILIRSCRGLELTFEVFSDSGPLGSDDSLGWTTLRLPIVRNHIKLNLVMYTVTCVHVELRSYFLI